MVVIAAVVVATAELADMVVVVMEVTAEEVVDTEGAVVVIEPVADLVTKLVEEVVLTLAEDRVVRFFGVC